MRRINNYLKIEARCDNDEAVIEKFIKKYNIDDIFTYFFTETTKEVEDIRFVFDGLKFFSLKAKDASLNGHREEALSFLAILFPPVTLFLANNNLVQLTLNADDVLVRIIIPVKYFRTRVVYKSFCQAILSSHAIEYNSNGLILVMSPDTLALFTEVIKIIIEIMARKSYKKIILMGLRKGNLDCLSYDKTLTNDRNILAWQDILSTPNKICSPWHGRVVKSLWTQKINYGNIFYASEKNPKPSLHKLKHRGIGIFHFLLLIIKTMIALIPIVGFIFCCIFYILEEKKYLKKIKRKVAQQAEEQKKNFQEVFDERHIQAINDILIVNSGKSLGILLQRNIFRILK
ncbi:hypothetical protein PIROE2DRAFT_3728 [Piromyces sp. E2]|nr:hypothetical protein PIROE2DRAFT_3728 [Piromyces sp. E2]|eukprot:OUM68581.1 hypothetical protein PIROE2DRAFT_3728 [Piromyces sp. E2]